LWKQPEPILSTAMLYRSNAVVNGSTSLKLKKSSLLNSLENKSNRWKHSEQPPYQHLIAEDNTLLDSLPLYDLCITAISTQRNCTNYILCARN